jgi:acyl carrier protein
MVPPAPDMTVLENELKALIVEALVLDDIEPDEIDPQASLFGDDEGGLALDSIDVLELAMALNKKYGVQVRSDDERNREIFATVHSLAAFVQEERGS